MRIFLANHLIEIFCILASIGFLVFGIMQWRQKRDFEQAIDNIIYQEIARRDKSEKIVKFLMNSGWEIKWQSDDLVIGYKKKKFSRKMFYLLMTFSFAPGVLYVLLFMISKPPEKEIHIF